MNKIQKAEIVAQLSGTFLDNAVVIVLRNHGLSVFEANELRKLAKSIEGNYVVVKNKLAQRALKGSKIEALSSFFSGPTAIACANDPVAVSKLLASFSKKNEKLEILGGIMSSNPLSASDVKQLALLPSMDELRAKIVGLINAPATKVARLLKAPATKVCIVIQAHSNK